MDFISFGATPDNLCYSIFLGMGILIEIFLCHFSKGCEIYADKNTKDLLEEDPRDRVQKETDLLKWYDPRLLLMPIIMPLVRMCFKDIAEELAERNLDGVNTDMSDVKSPTPQAIKFTQHSTV